MCTSHEDQTQDRDFRSRDRNSRPTDGRPPIERDQIPVWNYFVYPSTGQWDSVEMRKTAPTKPIVKLVQ